MNGLECRSYRQVPDSRPPSDSEIRAQLHRLDSTTLLRMRVQLEAEMVERGEAFSVGDIGQAFVVAHFKATPNLPVLQPAPTGTKNVDCLSRDGDRYSVKTLWKAKKTGTVYPDREQAERHLFEYLLLVRLGDNLGLRSITRFSWAQFVAARKWDRRMSAWYLSCSSPTLALGETLVESQG